MTVFTEQLKIREGMITTTGDGHFMMHVCFPEYQFVFPPTLFNYPNLCAT